MIVRPKVLPLQPPQVAQPVAREPQPARTFREQQVHGGRRPAGRGERTERRDRRAGVQEVARGCRAQRVEQRQHTRGVPALQGDFGADQPRLGPGSEGH